MDRVCVCVYACVCVWERKRGSEREETNLIMRIMQLQHACSAGALELFLSFLFLVNFCIANINLYWRAYVSVCAQTEFTVGGVYNARRLQTHIFGHTLFIICSEWTLTDTGVCFWGPKRWSTAPIPCVQLLCRGLLQNTKSAQQRGWRHLTLLLLCSSSHFSFRKLYIVCFGKCDGWGSTSFTPPQLLQMESK